MSVTLYITTIGLSGLDSNLNWSWFFSHFSPISSQLWLSNKWNKIYHLCISSSSNCCSFQSFLKYNSKWINKSRLSFSVRHSRDCIISFDNEVWEILKQTIQYHRIGCIPPPNQSLSSIFWYRIHFDMNPRSTWFNIQQATPVLIIWNLFYIEYFIGWMIS